MNGYFEELLGSQVRLTTCGNAYMRGTLESYTEIFIKLIDAELKNDYVTSKSAIIYVPIANIDTLCPDGPKFSMLPE